MAGHSNYCVLQPGVRSITVGLLLVATGASLQPATGPSGPDTSVGHLGLPRQAQEWGAWSQPGVEPLDVEEPAARPAPATRLRRRRRKRIRPYNQDVASPDYDEHTVPLRPTRPRYEDSEDNHEPPLYPEDRPYRVWPRRRRLKPRQRLVPLREETLLDEAHETPWREDDAYHGGRQRLRRPIVEGEYIPVPRARSRKRRPPHEPYLDYPASEAEPPQLPREPPHSKEMMIYGDDPVPLAPATTTTTTTNNEERQEQPSSTVRHAEVQHVVTTTTTERVNTFRPSKPRRLTSPPSHSSPAPSTRKQAHHEQQSSTRPTETEEVNTHQHISSISATPTELHGNAKDYVPSFSSTKSKGALTLTASYPPVVMATDSSRQQGTLSYTEHKLQINKQKSVNSKEHNYSELENLASFVSPHLKLPASDDIEAKTNTQSAVFPSLHDSLVTKTPQTKEQQMLTPLDVQESSDIDPVQRSDPEHGNEQHMLKKPSLAKNTSPLTIIPKPIQISLEPHIKSIEELVQKTRQSLDPAPSIHMNTTSQGNEPMKKTIPLSTSSPTTSSTAVREDTEESTPPQLQHPRDEIVEMLRSQDGSSRLARILQSRNMTLQELLAHRERGSSQQHLSEIFSDTMRTPATPMREPEHNCSSHLSAGHATTPKPQHHSNRTAHTHLVAKLFEETSKRSSRMFNSSKMAKDTEKHPDRDKYTPLWKTLYPHSFGFHLETNTHQEEPVSTGYKKVDLDDGEGNSLDGETAGKVDKVQTNDPAVNFAHGEGEQAGYEESIADDLVLGGFSIPVKSGIIASCAILLLTVLVFAGILVGCRWRQRRARRRYVEGIVGARERSTSMDELRGKGVGRSLTPVLVGARDLYSRPPVESRRYYLWTTIRKTLRYK